jgi:simple sugar transport system permease protein
MVLASLLLAFLSRGASEISAIYQLNHAFGDIISGIIIFFIIGSEFYINYKVNFGGKDKGKAKSAPAVVTAEAADADADAETEVADAAETADAEAEAADAAETADAADAEVTEDITTEDRKEGSDNV